MYTNMVISLYIIVIIGLNSYPICGEESEEKEGPTAIEYEQFLEEVLPDLYRNYREALERANETSYRRILKNNRLFQMHVEKLKEVNGVKKHNLVIKLSTQENPLIYINNPVETKLPHPYLTIEEFKKLLTDRVLKQRKEFVKKYMKPKTVEKKYTPGMAENKNIIKVNRQRKLSTVRSTDKTQTKSTEHKIIITKTSSHIVTTVTSKPNSTTGSYLKKTNRIVKNKATIVKTTHVTLTTQVTDKLKFDEVMKSKTLKDTRINNSTESVTYRTIVTKVTEINNKDFGLKQQNIIILKLNKTKPLDRKELNQSKGSGTENAKNAVTAQVVNRSNLEEKNKNITEFGEGNTQVDKTVEQTSIPENFTIISKATTSQYKDNMFNRDSKGYKQNTTNLGKTNLMIEQNEENTQASKTKYTSEVITHQSEENNLDIDKVTEDTTSTTVITKMTQLSGTDFGEEQQTIPKLNKTEPLERKEVKISKENVTENSVNSVTAQIVEVKRSDSEESNKQVTEFVEENTQVDKIVEQTNTPENVTTNVSETTTTEYKDLLTINSEGNEQNTTSTKKTNSLKARDNEENTEASTTNDISGDGSQETEEDSSGTEEVSEETTSTTVLTKRTRLSRPLVFMANDQKPAKNV